MVLIDAVVVTLAIGALLLLCAYRRRKVRLAEFARRATQGCLSQRDAAFALGRAIFGAVKRGRDPVFLTPLLASLGASPTTILREGGCCSGVHRLFITSLDTLGIRAAQITVYRREDPAAAHCLAQVTADSENLLIDVDYGVWLRRADGAPIDLAGLRSGLVPAIEPFVLDREAPQMNSARTRAAGYPDRDYYRFDYGLTRTANWALSPLKRATYAVLHALTRGRVDFLLLPPIFEWPEVLLAAGLCFATVMLLAARALTQS
jgi:hypothetical protein